MVQRLSSFASDVRGVLLTGLNTATSGAITATDTVLAALGKLQATTALTPQPGPWKPTDALGRRAKKELSNFTDWCQGYNVRGCIGEFGVPNGSGGAAGDDVKWATLKAGILQHCDMYGIGLLAWAVSTLYAGNELCIYTGTNMVNGTPASAALEARQGNSLVFRGVGQDPLAFGAQANGYSNASPGSLAGGNYFQETAGAFTNLGIKLPGGIVRIGFKWERIQPTLSAALNATYLGYLTSQVGLAKAGGLKVILDCHNYAEYYVSPGYGTSSARKTIGQADGTLTNAHFVDLWSRLSAVFASEVAVIGYGLMNEPHDMNAGGFTATRTLYDFTINTGAWSNSPTRDTTVFTDGAAKFVLSAGAQPGSTGPEGNLGQYGDTLAMMVRFSVGTQLDLKLQRGTGNANGAQYSQKDQAAYTIVAANTNTLLTWQPGATELASVQQIMINTNTAGTLYIDYVVMGNGARAGNLLWQDASQAVVTALRQLGDRKTILVSGYAYSYAGNWTSNHPNGPWITDPANNIVYEAHYYPDGESSTFGAHDGVFGTYTYAAAVADAVSAGY